MTDSIAEWVDRATLTPWAENPVRHDEAQVAVIVGSLREHGWTQILAAHAGTRRLIIGHGRLAAVAALLAAEPTWTGGGPAPGLVPVRWYQGSWAAAKRAALVDNRSGELRAWDDGLLRSALSDIDTAGLGWDDGAISALLEGASGVGADEWGSALGGGAGGRGEFRTRSFNLTAAQAEVVDAAVQAAGSDAGTGGNRNAAALAVICRAWLDRGEP